MFKSVEIFLDFESIFWVGGGREAVLYTMKEIKSVHKSENVLDCKLEAKHCLLEIIQTVAVQLWFDGTQFESILGRNKKQNLK